MRRTHSPPQCRDDLLGMTLASSQRTTYQFTGLPGRGVEADLSSHWVHDNPRGDRSRLRAKLRVVSVEPSEYVKRLPIGERIPFPTDGIPFWEVFPYEGELQIKVLEEPTLPEPPRHGEAGAEDCRACNSPDADFLWTDEHWRLGSLREPAALPAMVLLQPRGHYDLHDLPPERAAELGAMLQRVERAIMSLGGIARVHVNKWGDGGAHLHMFLIARPEGMMQMRGTCLPLWDDVLPKLPNAVWTETNRRIAQAMATGGGIAHL